MEHDLLEKLEKIAVASKSLNDVGMITLAASLAAIVSTSYRRPSTSWHRWIYFLFLPGWALIIASLVFGDSIQRRLLAAYFVNEYNEIFSKMNSDYIAQINYFTLGVISFVIWAVFYVCIWILSPKFELEAD